MKRGEAPTDRDPARRLQLLISSFMEIDTNAVIVLRISLREGSVVICDGDVNNFIETVNTDNSVFEGTLLEGATIPTNSVIFNVPCDDFISSVVAPLSNPVYSQASENFLPSSFLNDPINGPSASSDASSLFAFSFAALSLALGFLFF